ncbi:hypothetical protein MLD52_22840, partial [Puniceicoccaceae bacterium K14]|nr:hypothetical protein [Puniceicoccaceae bacterium K14]
MSKKFISAESLNTNAKLRKKMEKPMPNSLAIITLRSSLLYLSMISSIFICISPSGGTPTQDVCWTRVEVRLREGVEGSA